MGVIWNYKQRRLERKCTDAISNYIWAWSMRRWRCECVDHDDTCHFCQEYNKAWQEVLSTHEKAGLIPPTRRPHEELTWGMVLPM